MRTRPQPFATFTHALNNAGSARSRQRPVAARLSFRAGTADRSGCSNTVFWNSHYGRVGSLTLLGSDSLLASEFEVRIVTERPEVIEDWWLQPGTGRSDPHRMHGIRGTFQRGRVKTRR